MFRTNGWCACARPIAGLPLGPCAWKISSTSGSSCANRGPGTRAVLEHALAAQNLTVDGFAQASVVESLDVIKILVEHDLGISFLYEAAVARELAAGTLRVVDLEGLMHLHDIAFVRLKNRRFRAEFGEPVRDL